MIQAFEKILSECEEQIKKDFLGYYEHYDTLMHVNKKSTLSFSPYEEGRLLAISKVLN